MSKKALSRKQSKITTRQPSRLTLRKERPVASTGLYDVVYNSALGKSCAVLLLATFLIQATYVSAGELDTTAAEEVGLATVLLDESIEVTELMETDVAEEIIMTEDESELEEAGASDDNEMLHSNYTSPETDQLLPAEMESIEELEAPVWPEETSVHEWSADTSPYFGVMSEAVEADALVELVESQFDRSGHATITSAVSSNSSLLFNRNQCTELASGSYYCYQVPEDVLQDALFAAPDEDGDLEIFIVREGIQQQITHNLVDDAAPFYDEITNTIVWHRLVNDRYQIISYDLRTGRETQLTDSPVNNMEPVRQGSYTVWQRWQGASWQVVLFDGTTETLLSRGNDHNVAPHINGDLVVWNRHAASGKRTLEVYNLVTGSLFSLDDPDGLAVENPRMMLVYDTVHQNGELVTRGYDIRSGQVVDIDTKPRPLPVDLPKSEQTGEVRALIQSKPTVKAVDLIGDEDDWSNSDPDHESAVVDPLELDLRSIDLSAVPQTTKEEVSELVIPPFEPAGLPSNGQISDETVKESD